MLYGDRIDKFIKENVSYGTMQERYSLKDITLHESDKIQVTDKIVATMYQLTMNKYSGIDFGTIPNSRGNISKLKEYETMKKVLEVIAELASTSNNTMLSNYSNILNETMNVLEAYNKEFTLGFIQENQMIMMIYNTVVTSLICGIDFTITFIVDYLITPNGEIENSEKIKQSANSKDFILFKNLESTVKIANEGTLKKMFNTLLKNNEFIGSMALTTGVGIAAISIIGIIAIVPVMRELIYLIFNIRMKISEFFKIQAEFLELNIIELRSTSMPDKKRNEIIKKQKNTIKTLNSLSDKFELEFKKSQNEAEKELSKKVSPIDLKNSLADVGDNTTGSFGLL